MFIHLFVVFQWFNPFIWLYKKDLEQNLEFITDELTEQYVQCKKGYQRLLLKASLRRPQLILVNNFYNSFLKNRIQMLHRDRSTKTSKFKLVLIAPLLMLFLLLFNTETIAQTTDDDKKVVKIKKEITAILVSKTTDDDGLKKVTEKFAEKRRKSFLFGSQEKF